MAETQISAFISDTTKELVERYVEAHGVKKGHLIEEALLHHLQALRDLPADPLQRNNGPSAGYQALPMAA
jgi:hypothetical protein